MKEGEREGEMKAGQREEELTTAIVIFMTAETHLYRPDQSILLDNKTPFSVFRLASCGEIGLGASAANIHPSANRRTRLPFICMRLRWCPFSLSFLGVNSELNVFLSHSLPCDCACTHTDTRTHTLMGCQTDRHTDK